MGILLFIIILIFEIAFAAYCIVTKQNHKKIKSYSRIAAFIAFVVLVLSPIMTWSFRWVMLSILLLLLAIKATISLIRNKENNTYKPIKTVLKSIAIIVVTIVSLAPAIVFPQHQSPKVTGEYEIATVAYTYTDKNRIEQFADQGQHRFVNVEFYYPKNADGTYPLLVFSHGAYGYKDSNSSTYAELASHGYVVVTIDHPYYSLFTRSEDGTITTINSDFVREIENMNNGVYSNEELNERIQKWMELRTEDMNFVIDTILEKTKNENSSMGGAASVSLGRERNDISAVVNIDAPFFSELVYNKANDAFEASSVAYTTPLFNIYSDDVWVQLDTTPVYVANKLDNKQFEGAYTTYLKGAKHLSLTDLPLFSPILANMLQGGKADIDPYYCIETQNQLILEFFNYELKGIGHFNPNNTY